MTPAVAASIATLAAMTARWLATRRRGALVRGRLAAAASPAGVSDNLTKLVADLALPPHLPSPAVLVPASVIGAPCLALAIAGPTVALATSAAAAAGLWWLRRSAPDRVAAAAETELPGVLEAVARRLRAGSSLSQAVVDASPAAGRPLAPSWQVLARTAAVRGLADAADDWAAVREGHEPPRPAVRLAAVALAVAAETGGSPARALDGVAATLRARVANGAEIRALTSQARASAAVIALSPLLFGVFSGATDPRIAAFYRTPAGTAVVLAGLALDGVGALWMARLCRAR